MLKRRLRRSIGSLIIFLQIIGAFSGYMFFSPPTVQAAPVKLYPQADAAVDSQNPATTYTNMNGTYQLSIIESPTNTKRPFLRFDLASVNANIESAQLFVSASPNSTPVTVSVYAIADDSWAETTPGLTWNNQPALGALIGTLTLPSQAAGTYVEYGVDITDYIRQQKSGDGLASLALVGEVSLKNIYAKEATVSSRKPHLDITYDTTAPLFQSALVGAGFRDITVQFNEPLFDDTGDNLKSKVLLSTNGTTFSSLGPGDTVSLSGNNMIISLQSPLQGGLNKLKLLGGSLKDRYNNTKTTETVTGSLVGQEDLNPPGMLGAEMSADGESITLSFDKAIAWHSGDAVSNKMNVKLSSNNGSIYSDLAAGDSVSIQNDRLVVSFATPLVGKGYKVKVLIDSIKGSSNNRVLSGETVTEALMGRVVKTVLSASADAHVNSGASTVGTNYGSQTAMELKEGGTTYNRRIFLKFNVGDIGVLNSAWLRLYFPDADTTAQQLKLYAVTDDSWSETGITYNNQPSYSTVVSSVYVGGVNGWYQWNVTDYVNQQKSADGTVSFMLMGSNSSKYRTVSSKESGANKPQLVVEYDVAPPELIQSQVSFENKVIQLQFNEYVKVAAAEQNALKQAIALARDGSHFAPLAAGDTVTMNGSTLTVSLANRLDIPGARIRLEGGSLKDWAENVMGSAQMMTDLVYDAAAPVLNPVAMLDAANQEIKITGMEPLYSCLSDPEELKAAIRFAIDGNTYQPLGQHDSVTVSGGNLVVHLAQKVSGTSSRIRVAANTVKDEAGNAVSTEFTSEAITADSMPPQLLIGYAVNLNKKIVLAFNETIKAASTNLEELKASLQISTNGGVTYQPLGSDDSVQISGSSLTINKKEPITGTANRVSISAGMIQDQVDNVLTAATETTDIAAGRTDYPYAPPSSETLERALIDSANIVFSNKDAAQGSTSELTGSKSFEVIAISVMSGNNDPKLVERCVRIIRKMLTNEVNMPNLQGGLDSRGQSSMVSSIALLWNNQEVMSRLTEAEKSQLVTFFKAALISTAFTSSDYDQNDNKRSGSRLAMNGDPNTYTSNPNFWEPNMTLLYASAFVLGTENVKAILQNYDHMAFIQELANKGLTSIKSCYEKTTGFGTLTAKAARVEGIVKSDLWSFRTISMDAFLANPMKLHAQTQQSTWDRYAEDGDYMGKLGMEHEFDSTDASGPRESSTYAVLGIDPSLQNRALMDYFGYWNARGSEALRDQVDMLQKVGVSDYYAKTINGYYSQSRGGTKTEHFTGDVYTIDTLISIGGLIPALFHDTFDYTADSYSALTDEWILGNGNWSIKQDIIIPYNIKSPLTTVEGAKESDEEERLLQETSGGYASAFTKKSYSNVSFLAWVRMNTPGEIGIMGRVQDANNGYLLTYANGSLAIKKKSGGTTTTLIEKPYTLQTGVSYRFRGVFTGSNIEFYINGSKELSITDTAFSSGGIGVFSNQASGKFDGILVQPTSMPEPVLNTIGIGDEQVTLHFTGVEGALYYYIRYGTEPGRYTHTIKTISTAPIVTGLTNNISYFFAVSAVGTLGESAKSAELLMTPRAATAVSPKLKNLVADGNKIIVDFTTDSVNTSYVIQYGNASGEYKYKVERVTGSPWVIPVAISQMPNYVVVVPWNENGAGTPSNEMAVVPNDTILLKDDFNDGSYLEDWQLSAGTFSVDLVDGDYRLKSAANNPDRIFVAQGFHWKDYSIATKVEITNPFATTCEEYLLGRYLDYNNYYLLGYKYDQVQNKEFIAIRKKVAGTTTTISQKEFPIAPNREHLFKATFEGNEIKLYVDGILVVEVTDSDLSVGTAGILSGKAVTFYDDYTVELLNGMETPTIENAKADDGKAFISFTPVSGAEGYRVKYGEQSHRYTEQKMVTEYAYAPVEITGLVNGKTYYVTVSAYDAELEGGNAVEFSVTLPPVTPPTPLSSNADLSDLALSGGTLSPAFTAEGLSYSAGVTYDVSSITVKATASDSNATIKLNGAAVASGQPSGAISLNVGGNLINIVVTAQDGKEKTYALAVTRAASTSRSTSSGGGASGTISNNTVTSTDGTLTLQVGKSGEVSLGDVIKILIPADAFGKELKLTITKVADTQDLITNKDVLVSSVFEILKNFPENFSKEITLTFTFDLVDNQKPSVFYYDETKQMWVGIGGEVNGNTITVKVNHFTKFAVFGESQGADTKPTINFSDISGHWAEGNIKQAVSSGVVSGYEDGTFKPDRTVTRAEFAVMLMNVLRPQGDGVALTFTDKAKIGTWAQKSVAQAVSAGITTGYEDGSFRPDAQITRPEMAVMIAKATGQSSAAAAATDFADDKGIPDWAKGAVAAMKKLSIIEGKGTNQFAPADKTTRAEAVTVLLKMQVQKSK
ncbi:DNRLRE domain-containing protein [Paenibacillus sp. FSL H7-0331]|uniref:CBM96 family carbohydrate-binding protein n=1 Tax=Paenibacillus sp. FSL H7-0331 TaxID=1920421 RepID=UPI0015C3D976|nr:DNRLRE domain-containing protein [Paenibacillus sp. FSL H7-0331]